MRLPLKRLLRWNDALVLALFALLSVLNVVAVEQDYYKVGACRRSVAFENRQRSRPTNAIATTYTWWLLDCIESSSADRGCPGSRGVVRSSRELSGFSCSQRSAKGEQVVRARAGPYT